MRRQRAAMALDDAVADGQAQAGALAHGLGREEGLKNAGHHLGRNAGAVVVQRDHQEVRLAFGADLEYR